ncbi:LAFE_0G05710g1_1 [Lachancea fermentati]|uniref:Potassium transport protein n=1 Tax=Lachancea fermentati TaxID=4955 RepID=A0A1G4MHA7_LACFM|nr:LAFE_0G05710g1_1 [Lachancea fermentati]
MNLLRTISRRPTLASVNIRYHKTVGHRLRDIIEWVSNLVHPFVKHFFPNFIAVHYFYIISLTLLASILMYPVKNFAYIDILFTAAGAATQGGLNTINVNDMSLYQQIVIYVICFLTTPIWIHGGLAFVRLYWFERYFDGIKDWSKRNFKMRRTKTLIQRELSRTMSSGANRFSNSNKADNDFQSKLFSGQMVNREETENNDNYEMQPIQEQDKTNMHKDTHTSSSMDTSKSSSDDSPVIRFGNMPKPEKVTKSPTNKEHFKGRRRSRDISPADMYRSISMLQNRHKGEHENEGPALVISGPAERRHDPDEEVEASIKSNPLINHQDTHQLSSLTENSTTIQDESDDDSLKQSDIQSPRTYGKPSEISFSTQSPPIEKHLKNSGPSIQFDIKKPPSTLKRNNTAGSSIYKRRRRKLRPRLFRRLPSSDQLKQRLRRFTNDSDDDGNDADLEEDSNESDEGVWDDQRKHKPTNEPELGEMSPLEKAQSNLALPSKDATGGLKFSKRSNTLETPSNPDFNSLTESPSFQKMIYKKWKDERRRNRRFRPSAYIHPSLAHSTGELSHWTSSRHRRTPTVNTISPDRPVDANNDEEESYFGLTFDHDERSKLKRMMSTNYLSYQPRIGRNSTFVGLNDSQKAELGGVEHRAIKLLCRLLLIYYFGFHLMGIVMIVPWISKMNNYKTLVREDGVSPGWWGVFTSMSAFNDLGLTLTPDSMLSFNKAIYPLITMMWFIIIGNTGFPILLRFIIWILFKLSSDLSLFKESLGFLLDHPRRCFTLLFPSAPTWWLLLILVVLNVTDLILFIVLDLNSKVVEGLTSGFKVLDGLFQAVSTRTAGFTVLNLSQLHPSVQVSYMLMMYVSVLPLAISIRRTNVYEEQSLGIYGEDGEEAREENSEFERKMDHSARSFIGAHLRRQLSFDLWFLFLGLFILCISEGPKIKDPKEPDFTVFQVLFEVVSAYGTVGLSLGYPNTDQSFSAQFNTFSKLVIIAMLIRGRHRGLPYSLDRAIILPSDKMEERDHLEDLKMHNNDTDNKDPILSYLRNYADSIGDGLRSMFRANSNRHRNEDEESRLNQESRLDEESGLNEERDSDPESYRNSTFDHSYSVRSPERQCGSSVEDQHSVSPRAGSVLHSSLHSTQNGQLSSDDEQSSIPSHTPFGIDRRSQTP